MRSMRLLAVLMIPVVALIMGGAVSNGWAQDCWWNIEFNASDGDVGVRGFFDNDPWKELEIEDPKDRTFIEVGAENKKMRRQGLAEWFFESGEPTLLEVSFETFLRRFRPGLWEFEAEPTGGGDEFECEELFTHVIPCAPVIGVEEVDGVISITWDEVTTGVNTVLTDDAVAGLGPEEEWEIELLNCTGPAPTIIGYEVIVEEAESGKIYKIDVPANVLSVMVPPEFLDLGDEFQYEVLAIEESGNQTITEEEFCLGEPDLECPEDPEE